MASLEEIERKIAELEKGVGSDSDEEEEFVENDNQEEEDEDQDDEDDIDLSPIPHLPSELVPRPGLYLSTAKRERIEKAAVEKQTKATKASTKRVECSTCCEWFEGEEAFKKHSRTLKHRQNVVLRAGAAYEPAHHEPNYCRACEKKFDNVEDLLTHRKTPEHKDATEKLARASYCQLCKKQFTSPVQLRAHILGKAHNDLVEKKTGYRPVPLEEKPQSNKVENESKKRSNHGNGKNNDRSHDRKQNFKKQRRFYG